MFLRAGIERIVGGVKMAAGGASRLELTPRVSFAK